MQATRAAAAVALDTYNVCARGGTRVGTNDNTAVKLHSHNGSLVCQLPEYKGLGGVTHAEVDLALLEVFDINTVDAVHGDGYEWGQGGIERVGKLKAVVCRVLVAGGESLSELGNDS